MTDGVQASSGDAVAAPGTLVCEGSTCAVVGAGMDDAVGLAAPGTPSDWLAGLLVKQISKQVDEAGASAPRSG